MCEEFMEASFAYRKVKIMTYTLLLIRQKEEESLYGYVKQFQMEFVELDRTTSEW